MRATPKRKASIETRYYGQARRLRLLVYADGTARVYYRRPLLRGLWSGQKFSWEFVGDFPQAVAEHIAETFVDAVEAEWRAADIKRREVVT